MLSFLDTKNIKIIIDKIRNKPIFMIFNEMHNETNSKSIHTINEPNMKLSIGQIEEKLTRKGYLKLEEWTKDMEKIWRHALDQEKSNPALYLMAIDLQQWFRRKIGKFPQSSDELWINSLISKTNALRYSSYMQKPKK